MAITRLTLSEIIEHIRLALGEPVAARSKVTDAQIVKLVNAYGQTMVAKAHPRHFGMYRAASTLSCSAGSATVYLPSDCDDPISFYDTATDKTLPVIENVKLYHPDLVKLPTGPARAIELLDFALNSTTWQRKARLWPTPVSGTTPTIDVDYWRLPASFANSSPTEEYADCDPKFQMLFVYGTLLDLVYVDDPGYQAIKQMHDELFVKLLETAE